MTGTQVIKILVIVISFTTFAGLANAQQWNCYSIGSYSKPIVVVTADTKKNTGTVKVADTIQSASYSVQGFNRRWDFGDSNNYAFVIEPDGDASYYDLSRSDRVPSQHLYCKEVE